MQKGPERMVRATALPTFSFSDEKPGQSAPSVSRMLLGCPKSQPPCTGRGCRLSVPYRSRKKTWCTWQHRWTTTNVARYHRQRGETSASATTTCFNTGVSATVCLFSGGATQDALPGRRVWALDTLRCAVTRHGLGHNAPLRGACAFGLFVGTQLPLPRSYFEPLSFTKYSHLSYLTSI